MHSPTIHITADAPPRTASPEASTSSPFLDSYEPDRRLDSVPDLPSFDTKRRNRHSYTPSRVYPSSAREPHASTPNLTSIMIQRERADRSSARNSYKSVSTDSATSRGSSTTLGFHPSPPHTDADGFPEPLRASPAAHARVARRLATRNKEAMMSQLSVAETQDFAAYEFAGAEKEPGIVRAQSKMWGSKKPKVIRWVHNTLCRPFGEKYILKK